MSTTNRTVHAATFEPESIQEQLITAAAAEVRKLYADNRLFVKYDEMNPDPYHTACFDTVMTALEAENAVADPTVASIVSAIFKRAGWFVSSLHPTKEPAQVQMQIIAIDAAMRARQFFAKQAALI